MPLFKDKDKASKAPANATLRISTAPITIAKKTVAGSEEVFGKRFSANTKAEDGADLVDDAVNLVLNPVMAAKALYETNSSTINAAYKALADAASTTVLGRQVEDWMGTINKVVTGLEGLAKAQPFPFVETAVLLVKGVVTLETQRRNNTSRSRALILQIADMMSALLQLHFVKDPELTTETGESVCGRVQVLMGAIERDIKKCGNLIDTYHKHSLTSKFFFSGQYQDDFKAAAESLVQRKADIMFALQIHNTVGIDTIRAEAVKTNVMLVKLIGIVEHKSKEDKEWEQYLEDMGGRKKVIESEELITRMALEIEGRGPSKDGKDTKDGKDAKPGAPPGAPPDSKSKPDPKLPILRTKERLEMRQPLSSILEANFLFYEGKLDAQVRIITNQIQKSTQQILRRLESGSWEKIKDPEIREIWRENQWRSSVKARLFALALHDYYLDRYAQSHVAASQVETGTITTTISLTVPSTNEDLAAETPISEQAQSPTIEQVPEGRGIPTPSMPKMSKESIASTLADKWCLDYLTVPYLTAIQEAFDDDGSGFIRISEVNDFIAQIPEGWTLLQWIAYWARGWLVESARYGQLINETLSFMRSLFGGVRLENSLSVLYYFQSGRWSDSIDLLTYSAGNKTESTTDTPLDDLVKARMAQKEARLDAALQPLFYHIDAPETLTLVCGEGRLEKDLLATIHVLLRHHCRIIREAETTVLDNREFLEASNSLLNIVHAVTIRVQKLASTYHHLGLDETTQMARFAGGIFDYLHAGELPAGVSQPVLDEDASNALWESIIEKDQEGVRMRYGEWSVDTSAYIEKAEDDGGDGTKASADEVNHTVPSTVDESDAQFALPVQNEDSLAPKTPLPETSTGPPTEVPTTTVNVVETASQALSVAMVSVSLGNPVEEFPELVKKVLAGLEVVSKTSGFSFLKAVVSSIKSIANEEAKREDGKDLSTRPFVVQFLDAFSPLWQLQQIKSPVPVTENGTSLVTRLDELFTSSTNNTAHFENLIDAYNKIHPAENEQADKDEEKPEEQPSIPQTPPAAPDTPSAEQQRLQTLKDFMPRLRSQRQDIELLFTVHNTVGIERFRAAGQINLREIQERHRRASWEYIKQRRDLRKAFVGLTAKLLQCNEVESIWQMGISLTDEEDDQLKRMTKEIAPVDYAFWRSLGELEHRRTLSHNDRQCDLCETVPIVGDRYACLICDDVDLCANCESKRVQALTGQHGDVHHSSHPLIKLPRPAISIEPWIFNGFKRVYAALSNDDDSSSSSASSSSGSSEESDEETEATEEDEEVEGEKDEEKLSGDEQEPHGGISGGNSDESEGEEQEVGASRAEEPETGESDTVEPEPEEHEAEEHETEEHEAKEHEDEEHEAKEPEREEREGPAPVVYIGEASNEVANLTNDPAGPAVEGANTKGPDTGNDPGADGQAQVGAAATSEAGDSLPFAFQCMRCERTLSGKRYVTMRHLGAKEICPECENELMAEFNDKVLPEHLRLLLKCTLPEIEDDPVPAEGEQAQDSNDQDVAHHLQTVDGRLAALEAKFESVDSKLDQVLRLIQELVPRLSSTTGDDDVTPP